MFHYLSFSLHLTTARAVFLQKSRSYYGKVEKYAQYVNLFNIMCKTDDNNNNYNNNLVSKCIQPES